MSVDILSRLKIGPRLGLAFASVLLLTALMLLIAITRINALGQSSDTLIQKDWVKAEAAATLNASIRANARRTMELFFATDASQTDKIHQFIEGNKKRVVESLTTLDKLVESPEGKSVLAKVKESRAAYVASFSKVDKLLQAGQRDEAITVLKAETLPAIDVLQDQVLALAELQKERVDLAGIQVASEVNSARILMLTLGTGALLFGAVLAWWLTRSITLPLARAVAIAETVAAGDLTSDVHVESSDETGQLLAALKKMNLSLVHIVGQVRNSSESIATGSAQIASGNADLSQRTEEQASNLQQTAASMEQLTATVNQNSDTARQATHLASNASQAAAQGGRVVGQVVATMDDITQSSRKIADIIGVIDGIAFQTNILALNAAVEAARAGEQGRGFAVVASEVRSLAQRSAQAAKEIKTLIDESVGKVESGSKLVGEAGKSMSGIVAQVKRVNDLISEISAASLEQSSGIGQISDAVMQLDQVTQQNAALVEESAAAADSLKLQAAQLAQTVSVFKVPGDFVALVPLRHR
ncbi:MAG: MCP four helix bundle domain-containing protein [Ferruginibacter sp.]|nr:MCP four helix bundle domain-containing protein [Rhodoferax sp.]